MLAGLRAAAGASLLDVHVDVDHHRAVFTLAGQPAALVETVAALAATAVATIDLRAHEGVHPRLGALDVVPFAPVRRGPLDAAVDAREAATARIAALGVPVFNYGPVDGADRSLPEVRRRAFFDLSPDAGPPTPHPTAGATAVGAREPLVAWNAWVQGATLAATRQVAAAVRGRSVRALGLAVSGATQVSCNLLEPERFTPLDCYRLIEAELPDGAHVVRCELVGLVPDAALAAVPASWWPRLDLDDARAIGARVEGAGLAGGG